MMPLEFRVSLLLAALWMPLRSANAQRDSADTGALLKSLASTIASELATGKPPFGDERAGTKAWAAWAIEVKPSAHGATAVELQQAVLKATRARLRVPSDTIWTALEVESVDVTGDTAIVYIDRGTRWCSRVNGEGSSGYTYRYMFRRVDKLWQFAGAKPYIAYDRPPPMPDGGPYRCGV